MPGSAKATLPKALFEKVQSEIDGGALKDFSSASSFITYATRQALQARGIS